MAQFIRRKRQFRDRVSHPPCAHRDVFNRGCTAVILLQIVALCATTGCHRSFYRRQADAEAERLITEKANHPQWPSADGRLEIDPQSRMFNPFSADHAPIPPDDPDSHELMHAVAGHAGYSHWHANGDTDYVENPGWRSYLPVDEEGQTKLSLDRAFELAAIHSPLFQQQREVLYLSALDVSLQRFGFDTQLFAGFNNFLTTEGRLRNGTGQSVTTLSSSLGANGEGLNLQRLGVTGATFTAGLANSLIWNLAGNNTQTGSSLFDFSIIQPLLRGAGRERILESLTQSERTLLANVRQYERFRRGFYLQVAIGRNPGAGPSPSGDFLGLAAGANFAAGGYLGLLQQQQVIRNLEFNLSLLEGVLAQFRTFYDEDRIDSLQVRQFEATVFQQQQNLLTAKVNYQTAQDNFKQVLGLPPYLDLVIEDPSLDQFKIISDAISVRLSDISNLRIEIGTVIDELVDLNYAIVAAAQAKADLDDDDLVAADKDDDPDAVVKNRRRRQRVAKLNVEKADVEQMISKVAELTPLIDRAIETLNAVRQKDYEEVEVDIESLGRTRPDRIAYLRGLRRAIASGELPSEVEPQVFSDRSIPQAEDLLANLKAPDDERSVVNRLDVIERGLQTLASQLAAIDEISTEMDDLKVAQYVEENFQRRTPDLLTDLDGTILELALLQAEARSNKIEIRKVEISADQAFEIARCFRRDWMNARASLVDNWRQIEFVADQLESEIDLVFQGDVGNVGDNPFRFRYETGQLQVGIQVDSPVVRQSERNDYRQALIAYQQSRRSFYQFEDGVSSNLRQILRNIDSNKVLFELNRQSIQVNIDAVELSRFRLEQPPRIGDAGGFGQTTARDLTQAINGLNQVQNQYVQAYVEYEILRRSLDFDMGTMRLDAAGQWIDPGEIDSSIGVRTAAELGIETDCRFCQNIESFNFETATPTSFDETDAGKSVVEDGPIGNLSNGQQRGSASEVRPKLESESDVQSKGKLDESGGSSLRSLDRLPEPKPQAPPRSPRSFRRENRGGSSTRQTSAVENRSLGVQRVPVQRQREGGFEARSARKTEGLLTPLTR